MKKIISLMLVFLLLFPCLSGCKEKTEEETKIKIVATVFPPYDFARAIAGNRAEITQLVRAGSESHSFEPTPDDVKKAQDCHLFLMIGGESESWAERLSMSGNNQKRKTLVLRDYVTVLEAGSGEHHDQAQHSHHKHSHTHEHDEHIWTSPLNAIKMGEAILKAICELDSKNQEYYKANFENLKSKLLDLDEQFKSIAQNSENKPLIFGDRFPFLYLTQEYGFEYLAAFPGCNEQTQPDIKTIISLIEHIKEEKISTVYYTEFSSGQTANMLCEETGAAALLLHSCHNLTKDEWDRGETYISLMERNIKNLRQYINSP